MNNPILYVILNGELKMSPGKAAAQAVHAAMMLETGGSQLFKEKYRRTVVVLEAENSETLKNLHEYLRIASIYSKCYIDELSESQKPYQVTALAVDPIPYDDEEKRLIFETFPLYNGHVQVKLEDRYGYTKKRTDVRNGMRLRSWWTFKILEKASR